VLLLCGRAGIGKLEFARLMGKAILCERRGSEPIPCGFCAACHWFEEDAHPDFRQLQPELRNTVEGSGEEEQVPRKGHRQGAMISVDQVRNIADQAAGAADEVRNAADKAAGEAEEA